ncbi:MAG: MBL fold metallo-hydrolase [Myxococcota bacterium]
MAGPHRQEQEPASDEVTEVSPGILRMQLPIRMPGLGHVNMYALLDREGATVVDPGLPGAATWRAIQQHLKRAGLRIRDVHTVFVTHSHPDHFGGAVRLAREAGARVVAHHGFAFGPAQAAEPPSEVSVDDLGRDAPSVSAGSASPESDRGPEGESRARPSGTATGSSPMPWGGPTPWGGASPRPPLLRRVRWSFMRLLERGSFVPQVSDPVQHGDVLALGGREWFVVHTPGHTDDHVCLHDPDAGVFLAGDHVLPTITPHISGLTRNRDPLRAFFYSLDRVAEIRGVDLVLPAHGHPFKDLPGRAQAIKRHHDERLRRVREISREIGPATVAAFSRRLFKPRSWGSMAESETYAHLEHLRLGGLAEHWKNGANELVYQAH